MCPLQGVAAGAIKSQALGSIHDFYQTKTWPAIFIRARVAELGVIRAIRMINIIDWCRD